MFMCSREIDGDPHIKPLMGDWFDYPGYARYILVQAIERCLESSLDLLTCVQLTNRPV